MIKFPYPEVLLLLFEEAAESCPGSFPLSCCVLRQLQFFLEFRLAK